MNHVLVLSNFLTWFIATRKLNQCTLYLFLSLIPTLEHMIFYVVKSEWIHLHMVPTLINDWRGLIISYQKLISCSMYHYSSNENIYAIENQTDLSISYHSSVIWVMWFWSFFNVVIFIEKRYHHDFLAFMIRSKTCYRGAELRKIALLPLFSKLKCHYLNYFSFILPFQVCTRTDVNEQSIPTKNKYIPV